MLGKERQTPYKIPEIHAQYYLKDHRGRKAFYTIFKGLFLVANLQKSIGGKVIIIGENGFVSFEKLKTFIRKWLSKHEQINT